MPEQYTIRAGNENDFPAIITLIKEFTEFSGAPEKMTNDADRMKNERDYFRCLVVQNDQNEIIAYTTFFFCYFTWTGKSLYGRSLCCKSISPTRDRQKPPS